MSIVIAFIAGVVLWTLIEYLLHRFGGHRRTLGRRIMREHLTHHATPDHFAPFARKLVLAVPVLGTIALAGFVAMGPSGLAIVLGTTFGWTFYERLHRATHVRGPRNRYGEWARLHHLHHHFRSPKANHGVTTPMWDLVFGTLERPERVTVPRRHVHCFAWLLDGDDVDARYADRYRLAG